jgi:hypothetical protein
MSSRVSIAHYDVLSVFDCDSLDHWHSFAYGQNLTTGEDSVFNLRWVLLNSGLMTASKVGEAAITIRRLTR